MNLNDITNPFQLHKNKRGELFRTVRIERVEDTDAWVKEYKEYRSAWKILIEYDATKEMKWVYFNRHNHAYGVEDYDNQQYAEDLLLKKLEI